MRVKDDFDKGVHFRVVYHPTFTSNPRLGFPHGVAIRKRVLANQCSYIKKFLFRKPLTNDSTTVSCLRFRSLKSLVIMLNIRSIGFEEIVYGQLESISQSIAYISI